MCDVDLGGEETPVRQHTLDWIGTAVTRAAIDPEENPKEFWNLFDSLRAAHEAISRRERIGLYGYDNVNYTARRQIIQAYLREGGRLAPLCGNDRECIINLGPELPWFEVVATITGHNTKGESRIWRWDAPQWKLLEENLGGPMSLRALSRELRVAPSTIHRLQHEWYDI